MQVGPTHRLILNEKVCARFSGGQQANCLLLEELFAMRPTGVAVPPCPLGDGDRALLLLWFWAGQ